MSGIVGNNIVRDNLILHLDAADIKSYPGFGTTWTDRTSNKYKFIFSCIGASCLNPIYSNNSITTNFDTSSPYNFSYLEGTNLDTKLAQLLYSDHTIELCLKLNSILPVYNYDNSLTYENVLGLLLWVGYHGGVCITSNVFQYGVWNGTSNWPSIYADASGFVGQNIITNFIRSGNVLSIYINGILKQSDNIGSTASYVYNNLRIGCGNIYQPTINSFSWPSKTTYYSIKCYNSALTASQVLQNFNSQRKRFNI